MLDVLALMLWAWQDNNMQVDGWLIMKLLRRSGPVVYGALDRLEDAGWISGSWEAVDPAEDRPRRRFYQLTGEGVEAAREHAPQQRPIRLARLLPQILHLGRLR